MTRRRDRYVIGFDADGADIYGQNTSDDEAEYCNPMSLSEARDMLSEFGGNDDRTRIAIYRLVPIEITMASKIQRQEAKANDPV